MQVWTESAERKEAGGVYLFESRAAAEAYIGMHEARLKGCGIPVVNVKVRLVGCRVGWSGGRPAQAVHRGSLTVARLASREVLTSLPLAPPMPAVL